MTDNLSMNHSAFLKKISCLFTVVLFLGLLLLPTAVQAKIKKEEESVFAIYFSGIDTREDEIKASRSDVNIIGVVNTKTHQILLLSTPRDFYIPLSNSNGVPDKLTHAGIYGVDVCKDSLAMLYDTTIDYYFRINFKGFEKIIDTLGGITVHSDYTFDSTFGETYHYEEGENTLNGAEALTFCRERYAFPTGDRQRGKNQMAVMNAVFEKVSTPDGLKKIPELFLQLKDCYDSDVSYTVFLKLIKVLISDDDEWNICNYSADGTGDSRSTFSSSQASYVMVPNQDTVDKAKELIRQVREGEILSLD